MPHKISNNIAKDGYFYAKRETAEAIMRRVMKMEEELKSVETDAAKAKILVAKIEALEEIRSFIRNVMLWTDDYIAK